MAVNLSMAEERERRRIAAELHDHVGQLLLLCKMKFGSLPQSFMCGKEKETFLEAMDLLSRTIRDVRSMTQQLNPPLLANCGLEAALEWLAQVMETDFSLQVTCRDDGSHKPLSEELRCVLFQSARELLINVAKHAGCGEARLSIARQRTPSFLKLKTRAAVLPVTSIPPRGATIRSACSTFARGSNISAGSYPSSRRRDTALM